MASFIVYGDASGQVTVAAPAVAGSNTITFPAETGTLITSASTTLPHTVTWNTTVRTSGFTAAIDSGNFCNTTGGAFTVTLPATPTRGDYVAIVDYAGTAATNNITVSGNGANINGSTQNFTIAVSRSGLTFIYIDSTQGWVVQSSVYTTPTLYTASYLVVAGGGGGGGRFYGGGGGAGGYLTGTSTLFRGVVYSVTVGAGGAGGVAGANGTNGSNSTFTGVTTAIGGGGGANGAVGGNGGSGGGGQYGGAGAGSGTPGQGNSGGSGFVPPAGGGGGGGGASLAGLNATSGSPQSGGAGTTSSITGSSVTYAGGGGGSMAATVAYYIGLGGAGGGGNGAADFLGSAVQATAGAANTGGGGGAGCWNNTTAGAAGGSGVVILSVPTANYTGTVTGSPTVTTSGSNTIIRWTSGSGTYTA